MRKTFWNLYYKLKIALMKIKHPKAGRYERTLLSLGYTRNQIKELANDYPNEELEYLCATELFYLASEALEG